MMIDRRALLAFATLIATSSAVACADDADSASASQDITESSANDGECVAWEGEEAYPDQEGKACFDLYRKALDADYKHWSSPAQGGGTEASKAGCQAVSPSHPPIAGGAPTMCPTNIADSVHGKCMAFVRTFKKTAAGDAVKCLSALDDLSDAKSVQKCGFAALEKTCTSHPTAGGACDAMAAKLTDKEKPQCEQWLSGLRSVGRGDVMRRARDGKWDGLSSAVESVGMTPAVESTSAK